MKFKMRVIAACMLFAILLAACAPAASPAPQQEEASKAEPTKAEGVPAQEQVTITIWDFGGEEFDWVDNIAIPEFNKKFPNIKVEHLGIPESDYSTKLDTAITAGDVPDIALQSYTYKLWKAGHVLTLDNYMAQANLKPDDFYPIFKSWCMLDGQTYCMPVNTYAWAMIYNKDLFKEAGLPELGVDSVITFDDWLEYARKINKPADKMEDRVFGSVIFTPNWNAMNNYMSDPYVLGADGRNCKDNAATEEWIQAWADLKAAYKEDLTVDSAGSLIGQATWEDLFQQGKIGMLPGNYGDALNYKEAGINVGITGQPVVNKDWQGNTGAWQDGYAIMKLSEHPNEAWEFLKFLTTEVALMKATGECAVCGNAPSLLSQAPEWAEKEPMREDTNKLLQRAVPVPFSPDVWTAVDPFYEAFRLMTEEDQDPAEVVKATAEECQTKLDELWETFDSLGQ